MNGDLQLGSRTFPAKTSAKGGTYYDLSELCTKPDDKLLAFVNESSFTIQITAAVHGTTFVKKQPYLRYKKPVRWTTSAKVNAKGLVSFNLFLVHGSRLLNISLDPEGLRQLQDSGLGEAYGQLLRRLHASTSGKSLEQVVEEAALMRFRGARGFVALRKIESKATPYMDLLAHMYPAFADYASKSEQVAPSAMPARHRVAFPEAFIPYLRESSWNDLLRKLFGTRLSPEMHERLQPNRAPVALLAGAFLVRSLVPTAQLLDFEIEPFQSGKAGYPVLHEVRRLLRAVPVKNRGVLLQELRQSPNIHFHKLAKIISQATSGVESSSRKYKLASFEDVRTWDQLCQRASYIYHGQAALRLAERQRRIDAVKQLVADSFCSLPGVHSVTVGEGLISAHSMRGDQIELLEVLPSQVSFHPMLVNPGAFARNSALRQLTGELRRDGMAYSKARHLHLDQGEVAISKFVKILDASLVRQKIEPTRRNRTRLLVTLTMFGNSEFKEHNAIPPNAWALIASDLDLPQVYCGLILNATVAQMEDFAAFPAHIRASLTGYDPAKQASS